MPASRPSGGIELLVHRATCAARRLVLAVSGGLDSMVLLEAVVRTRGSGDGVLVATFDHGSGAHAARAAAVVSRRALALGVPVVAGRARDVAPRAPSEEQWRTARWSFLQAVADRVDGTVATAHTRDDQVETVLMRILRGAGARGLAALEAPSPVCRPLLACTRGELLAYARQHGVPWIEDPSNRDRRFLRNRLRHELLPALRARHPAIDEELLATGRAAAAWRRAVASRVDGDVRHRARARVDAIDSVRLDVVAGDLSGREGSELAVLWPELAGRAGITLDRRGTERLAQFTRTGRVGSRIQLSGGWEVLRTRDRFELRRQARTHGTAPLPRTQPLCGVVRWARWSFRPESGQARGFRPADSWLAMLPADRPLRVRAWQPGDVMTFRLGERLLARKVKYYLSDARISGHDRAIWPVVLAENEIVWIPGVRRSDAATVRPGGPTLTYLCDYDDR
ncbi:MAG TPA: tRNA lysidine(34) synthetase TilS [Gemmatimonadaceae bacterium]|nr:tRNA lysidine(34) synthetase TilS [Gemmatimonadaceae bacterium]